MKHGFAGEEPGPDSAEEESTGEAVSAGHGGPGLAHGGHDTRTEKQNALADEAAGPGSETAKSASGEAPVGGVAPAADGQPPVKPVRLRPDGEPIPDDAYVVSLPAFEGPLDLLLHLIQKHELDILDIPVSFVCEKYLEYLAVMRSLTLDVASEYLVMAATLVHIKSKMLLPDLPTEDDSELEGEEADPRAELVRRLLDYQKYKAAALQLANRDTLGNTVFPRGSSEPVVEGPAPFAIVGSFDLLDAFAKVLSRAKIKIEHEVVFDRISISDRITELVDLLKSRRSMPFEELFFGRDEVTRFELVITFLALLEMARLRMLRVFQVESLSPIHVELLILTEGSDDPLAMQRSTPPAGMPEPAEPEAEEPEAEEPEAEEPEAAEPEAAEPEAAEPEAEEPEDIARDLAGAQDSAREGDSDDQQSDDG